MPLVIRQALARRLSLHPLLLQLLKDLRILTGLPAYFSSPLLDGNTEPLPAELPPLCGHLQRAPGGCKMCVCFRQNLRDTATTQPVAARCDGGLWEVIVPVIVGTQVVGHLLVIGLADGDASARELNRTRHLLSRMGFDLSAEMLSRLRAGSRRMDEIERASIGRLLHALAEQAGRLFTEHLATPSVSASALVDQTYQHVHSQFFRRLRVSQLARELGVSPAHLSRTFHRATGLRLVDYVARYRAERARQLLLESSQPIATIAEACGFQSISQFNRVFRATYGQQPRDVRKAEGRNPGK